MWKRKARKSPLFFWAPRWSSSLQRKQQKTAAGAVFLPLSFCCSPVRAASMCIGSEKRPDSPFPCRFLHLASAFRQCAGKDGCRRAGPLCLFRPSRPLPSRKGFSVRRLHPGHMIQGAGAFSQVQSRLQCLREIRFGPLDRLPQRISRRQGAGDGRR